MHKHWKIWLCLVCLAWVKTDMQAQPLPYMGLGFTLEKKGSGVWVKDVYQISSVHRQLPEWWAKRVTFVSVHNEFSGRDLVISRKTTLEEVYEILIGPENSMVVIQYKQKGKKGIQELKLSHSFFENAGTFTDVSSEAEKELIKRKYPWHFCYEGFRPVFHDMDSLRDEVDACPYVDGPVRNNGCPFDTDKDGVSDKDDKCREVAGPIENRGCPWPDIDIDGVPNFSDSCMFMPGLERLNGCPDLECAIEIKKKEKPEDADDEDEDEDEFDERIIYGNDTDEDGICDSLDRCPLQWGPPHAMGCATAGYALPEGLFEKMETIYLSADKGFQGQIGTQIYRAVDHSIFKTHLSLPTMKDSQFLVVGDDGTKYFYAMIKSGMHYHEALDLMASFGAAMRRERPATFTYSWHNEEGVYVTSPHISFYVSNFSATTKDMVPWINLTLLQRWGEIDGKGWTLALTMGVME